MNLPNGWELILVLLVIVVVFGSKRLPDSARALGRSMRILKAETKGLRDDDDLPATTTAHVVTPVAAPQPVQQSAAPIQATAPLQATVPAPVQQGTRYVGPQLFDAQGRPVLFDAQGRPVAMPVPDVVPADSGLTTPHTQV